MCLRIGTLPLTFDLARLLVKHASTPTDVLELVASRFPLPPCENAYCTTEPEIIDNDTYAYVCGHPVEWSQQALLFTMLLQRAECTPSIIERVFTHSRTLMPTSSRLNIDSIIAAHHQSPAWVLADLSNDPEATNVTLMCVARNENGTEETQVAAALRQVPLSATEQAVADRLLEVSRAARVSSYLN